MQLENQAACSVFAYLVVVVTGPNGGNNGPKVSKNFYQLSPIYFYERQFVSLTTHSRHQRLLACSKQASEWSVPAAARPACFVRLEHTH